MTQLEPLARLIGVLSMLLCCSLHNKISGSWSHWNEWRQSKVWCLVSWKEIICYADWTSKGVWVVQSSSSWPEIPLTMISLKYQHFSELCKMSILLSRTSFRQYAIPCEQLSQTPEQALKDFLLQTFQKDPNLRISAEKLLKHPWLRKASQVCCIWSANSLTPLCAGKKARFWGSQEGNHGFQWKSHQPTQKASKYWYSPLLLSSMETEAL